MGLFEVANGGTLFLDEIGELPLNIQVKLLRAIQERVIRMVGGTDDIKIDVRIIAATNRNLEEFVKSGGFREDLYYRLNVIHIKSPSLRERREDIPVLAKHFLDKYNSRLGKNIKSLSAEAMEVLKRYDYPGNVRELENIIERTVALEPGATILPESLPPLVTTTGGGKRLAYGYDFEVTDEGLDLEKVIGQIEKEILIKAIHRANGVKKKAAKLLAITFRSMRYRVEKYGLSGPGDEELIDE
jgi:two-component system response regulator PilR (NtrC family)